MERNLLIAGGVILGVLLIASVAISLIRGESEFEPDSPEFAVQQYLKALIDNDLETARAMWSPELRESCSFEEFISDARSGLERLAEARITLEDVLVVGESTNVRARFVWTVDGGVFGPSENSSSYRYGVLNIDGGWRITDHDWPGSACVRSRFHPDRTPTSIPQRTSG